MGISLSKGGNISLSDSAPNLNKILVGLGWQERSTEGVDFDLDASAFLLRDNGKVSGDEDLIFYNKLKSQCGAIEHTGDDTVGAGAEDAEALKISLEEVDPKITKIVVCVTIHDAEARQQNFGQVQGAFIRIENMENSQEIVRFDLSEDYSTETAMIFGEVYRHDTEWKFQAVGQGYQGGLLAMCSQFGVAVD